MGGSKTYREGGNWGADTPEVWYYYVVKDKNNEKFL